ncbi:MAG TPA: hypothetical protein PLS53_09245 [Thermoanaerobaculaceae bacterium]|mgnify:CR=1 FL=1|nr:hypothetical protein [Thermoanaerobaculaceae bacterium]HPS78328.1 hypothetical protein [Thermoanaerobaculaceae bacterium]
MRTRWLIVACAVSLALNLAFGTALWRARGASHVGQPGELLGHAPCAEERAVREELTRGLCASEPDRQAIQAALARLEGLRQKRLSVAVERWLQRCEGAPETERAQLLHELQRNLCPWNQSGNGCCAQSPAAGVSTAKPAQPKPPRQGEHTL